MVRQTSPEVKEKIFELWVKGKNYREIKEETGVSIGAISNIVGGKRGGIPDIEELRALNRALKQADITVKDSLKGAVFLDKLSALNIQVDRIPACINLLNQYGEKAGELLEAALRLRELEVSLGKTYKMVIVEAVENVKKLETIKNRISELQGETRHLKSSLRNLKT